MAPPGRRKSMTVKPKVFFLLSFHLELLPAQELSSGVTFIRAASTIGVDAKRVHMTHIRIFAEPRPSVYRQR
jgi:hypothetical protein